MRENILAVFVLAMCVFFPGCETIKGAEQGFKQDVNNVCAPKDSEKNSLMEFVEKVDNWVKENMW